MLATLLSFPPAQPVADAEYDQKIRSLYSSLKQAFPHKFVDDSPGGDALLDVSSYPFNSSRHFPILP